MKKTITGVNCGMLAAIGGLIVCFLVLAAPCDLLAARIVVRPAGENALHGQSSSMDFPVAMPEFADTEVSTNFLVGAVEGSMREVKMRFSIADGSISNCVQLAFGRDVNDDGVLGYDETEMMFGWRRGRYFVESVPDASRIEDEWRGDIGGRAFDMDFRMNSDYGFQRLVIRDEADASVVVNLLNQVRDWRCRPDWNMVRVTRRGPGAPAEWCTCDIRSKFFLIRLK